MDEMVSRIPPRDNLIPRFLTAARLHNLIGFSTRCTNRLTVSICSVAADWHGEVDGCILPCAIRVPLLCLRGDFVPTSDLHCPRTAVVAMQLGIDSLQIHCRSEDSALTFRPSLLIGGISCQQSFVIPTLTS